MYCQACATKNPEDANYCKHCGMAIAKPGDRGGPIVEEDEPPAPSRGTAAPGADTVRDDGPPAAIAASASRAVVDAETSLAGLRSHSTNSMTNVSLSLVSMSIRTPLRSYLVVLAGVVGLVLMGAAVSYGVVLVYTSNEAVIATTFSSPPAALAPVEIGFPQLEGAGDLADLSSGDVAQQARGGGGVPSEASQPSSPSASGGGSKISTPSDAPRASSTIVEAPPSPSAGGAASSGGAPSGAGSASSETTDQASSGAGSSGSETSGTSTSTVMPPGFEDDDRDIEMDLYAGQVRRVIAQYYAARAQSCFDRSTRNNHDLRGTVVVQFTIGMDGNVSRTSVVRNTTGVDELGDCIAGQVGSWRLPPPPGERPVEMQMPFSW